MKIDYETKTKTTYIQRFYAMIRIHIHIFFVPISTSLPVHIVFLPRLPLEIILEHKIIADCSIFLYDPLFRFIFFCFHFSSVSFLLFLYFVRAFYFSNCYEVSLRQKTTDLYT